MPTRQIASEKRQPPGQQLKSIGSSNHKIYVCSKASDNIRKLCCNVDPGLVDGSYTKEELGNVHVAWAVEGGGETRRTFLRSRFDYPRTPAYVNWCEISHGDRLRFAIWMLPCLCVCARVCVCLWMLQVLRSQVPWFRYFNLESSSEIVKVV